MKLTCNLPSSVWVVLAFIGSAHSAECDASRYPHDGRSTYSSGTHAPLPWRTDYPSQPPVNSYPWETTPPQQDWRKYMAQVLSVIKGSGITISAERLSMPPTSAWWTAPWMDYGPDGRERLNGLTRERGPDPHDLGKDSPDGYQVWAIGWYNAEGAYSLGEVFKDPCNPVVPETGWKFRNATVGFKFLFTDADGAQVPYLQGAPEIKADIYPAAKPRSTNAKDRTPRVVRLLQVDITVRDPNAAATEWVLGTFVWMGPKTGDGLFDNLHPVGLAWGDDPGEYNPQWSGFAKLQQSALNPSLPHAIWQRGAEWPHRPFPGFQGRLNGPADNMRSSCISCHGLAQWPRSSKPVRAMGKNPESRVSIVPRYETAAPIDNSQEPLDTQDIAHLVGLYFTNVRGGTVSDPGLLERPTGNAPKTKPAISLDYSLQLEAGLARMCRACADGKLKGATPLMCTPDFGGRVEQPDCGSSVVTKFLEFLGVPASTPMPVQPRQ